MEKIELISKKIDMLIQQNKELANTNTAIKSELESANSAKSELEAKVAELETQNVELKSQLDSFSTEKEDLISKMSQLEEQTGMQDLELDELLEKLDSLSNIEVVETEVSTNEEISVSENTPVNN
jgi:chromosome segregation ATPase